MLLLVLLSKEFAWNMHDIELSIPCLLYSTHHIVSHTSRTATKCTTWWQIGKFLQKRQYTKQMTSANKTKKSTS